MAGLSGILCINVTSWNVRANIRHKFAYVFMSVYGSRYRAGPKDPHLFNKIVVKSADISPYDLRRNAIYAMQAPNCANL